MIKIDTHSITAADSHTPLTHSFSFYCHHGHIDHVNQQGLLRLVQSQMNRFLPFISNTKEKKLTTTCGRNHDQYGTTTPTPSVANALNRPCYLLRPSVYLNAHSPSPLPSLLNTFVALQEIYFSTLRRCIRLFSDGWR